MHDSDLYEKLKHSLEVLSLDCQEISDSFNQVFEILESRILMHFHEFNVLFKHFFEEYDKKNVDTILKIKEILKEHSLLKKNYERLFQEQFLYLTPFCNIDEEWAWSSDDTYQIVFEQKVKNEILDFYKGDESEFFNFKESVIEHELPFDNIKYNSLCFYDPEITFGEIGKRRVFSAIKRLYSIFVVVANYIESHLDISSFVTSNIHEAIVKEFKVYSKNNELNTLRELKRLAQKFKSSRSSPLTEEIWGELMRVEDCILENTISGISSSTDEEGVNFFDEYTLQEMKDNNGLVQKILNISSDESLFDFKYAFEPHINLLSSLNDNNLQLFYQLVLRRNLIQCEMFPELKTEYREFLKDDNNAEKNTSETACPILLDSLDASVRDYFLMKDKFADIVRVLNETIKPIVDATGNKANWDYVCFAFKLLNIVPRNLSREKFTNLIVAMCPDLGEASRLKSSMEHSGANYKEKFDVYENLSETNSLKSNSRQYVDALKKVL